MPITIPYNAYVAARFIDGMNNVMTFDGCYDGDPVHFIAGDQLNSFMWGNDENVSVSAEIKLYQDIKEAQNDPFVIRGPLQSLANFLEERKDKRNVKKKSTEWISYFRTQNDV